MIVRDDRLKELIKLATEDCWYCPLGNRDDIDCDNEPCLLAVTKWLADKESKP